MISNRFAFASIHQTPNNRRTINNATTTTNGTTIHRSPQRVQGLVSLSSSHKKRSLTRCFGGRNRNSERSNQIQICIQLDAGVTKRETFCKFIINVLQYLLYDNEVIPIPFPYFDRLCHTYNNGDMRILKSTFGQLNSAFRFITAAMLNLSNVAIRALALCLGDSIRFAKSIYTLDLTDVTFGNTVTPGMPLLSLNYLIRTFYKKLLNEVDEGDEQWSMMSKNMNKTKRSTSSVIFAVKIASKDVDEFEHFTQCYTDDAEEEEDEHQNDTVPVTMTATTNCHYRLGCTITKKTIFVFKHDESLKSVNNSTFDVYNDSTTTTLVGDKNDEEIDQIEEMIEEKLEDYEEQQLFNNRNASNASTDSILSTISSETSMVGSGAGGENEKSTCSSSSVLSHDNGDEKMKIGNKNNTNDDDDVDVDVDDGDCDCDDLSANVWVQICLPIRCHSKLPSSLLQ